MADSGFSLASYNTENIEYKRLTGENLNDALLLLEESFYLDENVSKCVELYKNPEAIQELQKLPLMAANDGLSVIAIDRKTNQVAGVAFNKIQEKKPEGELGDFEIFSKNCKQEGSRSLVDFMIRVDGECNLFELCNVDCLLEVMFLGTARGYRQLGIARTLTEISVEIGRKLAQGVNVKQHLEDGKVLPLGLAPKIATAIFTTVKSQKIGDRLGFLVAAEIDYDDFFTDNGKRYSDIIGPETATVKLVFKRLDKK